MAGCDRLRDAGQRNIAGAADKEHVQRHAT
jgi:hypothetical protein